VTGITKIDYVFFVLLHCHVSKHRECVRVWPRRPFRRYHSRL